MEYSTVHLPFGRIAVECTNLSICGIESGKTPIFGRDFAAPWFGLVRPKQNEVLVAENFEIHLIPDLWKALQVLRVRQDLVLDSVGLASYPTTQPADKLSMACLAVEKLEAPSNPGSRDRMALSPFDCDPLVA